MQMKFLMNYLSCLVEDIKKNLETSVEESDFLVDSVQSTYYKCHKVNLKRGGPSIDSPEWLKKINRLSNNRSKKIKMINVM